MKPDIPSVFYIGQGFPDLGKGGEKAERGKGPENIGLFDQPSSIYPGKNKTEEWLTRGRNPWAC